MNTLQKIGVIFVLIGAAILAMYVFAWFIILIIVAIPIAYVWWKWKVRKFKKVMHEQHHITIDYKKHQ